MIFYVQTYDKNRNSLKQLPYKSRLLLINPICIVLSILTSEFLCWLEISGDNINNCAQWLHYTAHRGKICSRTSYDYMFHSQLYFIKVHFAS